MLASLWILYMGIFWQGKILANRLTRTNWRVKYWLCVWVQLITKGSNWHVKHWGMAFYLPNLPMFSHTKIFPCTALVDIIITPNSVFGFISNCCHIPLIPAYSTHPLSSLVQNCCIPQTKKALHRLTNMANTKVRFVFLLQFNISHWCFPKCELCGFLIRRSHMSFGNLLIHCI